MERITPLCCPTLYGYNLGVINTSTYRQLSAYQLIVANTPLRQISTTNANPNTNLNPLLHTIPEINIQQITSNLQYGTDFLCFEDR